MLRNAAIDFVILTKRRREILDLVLEGLTNKEIGQKLFLSEHTVKTHIRKLFRIFEVAGRVELVIAAFRSGLVPCGRCLDTREARNG